MNRNSVFLDEFKKLLSPFAQIVLNKLLDSKNERNELRNIKMSYIQKERGKEKEISFDNFPNTSLEQVSRQPFNDFPQLSTQETKETRVSVSTDLLLPIRNDIEDNISINSAYTIEPIKPTHGTANAHVSKDCIDWNELFDKDFFDDFHDGDISKDVQVQIKNNIFDASIPPFSIEHTNKNAELEHINVGKEKIITSPNRNNVDRVANKVKKTRNTHKTKETSLRKERYTKTVKNWLNNVGETAEICNEDVNRYTVGNKSKNKKTIQTQLANKGGVMKFAIPKDKTDVAETVNEHLNKQARNEDNKEIKPNDVCSVTIRGTDTTPVQTGSNDHFNKPQESKNARAKEKKVKSKFIAPFVSPLPVKDVTYGVHVLDEHNLNEHLHHLQITNTEIIMVLVYSNGFNQLNGQYASSACAAEGLMLRIRDAHYYIKHFGKHFEEPVLQLLSGTTLVCFNAKEVLVYLMTHIDVSSCDLNIIDLKIGASLLSPEEPPDTFSGLQELLNHTSAFSISSECVLQKCARYMCLLEECDRLLRPLLHDGGMWGLFREIEMKALPIVAEMEHHGVCVDVDLLKSMESTVLASMQQVERECYQAAGRRFQINSALQVRTILYEELRLDTKCNIKIRETVCKAKSTSEAMLRLLAPEHPLPRLILEYRRLHKAHATFLAGILQHVQDGVVKPTWEQSAAVTGRIACHDPNLQAIPKEPFSLGPCPEDGQNAAAGARGAAGRAVRLRDAYVARAGRTLLAADFRHAECRVLALAAGDRALAAALRAPDLFAVLAAEWLGKAEGAVGREERARTKHVVYASLYGAGADTLARILRAPPARARAVLASFNKTFPALKGFGRSVVSQGTRQGGRLLTPGGRSRTFPQLASEDAAQRAHAERQAVNFIIQGSAADLCKAAMAAAARRLRGRCSARLVLQIHDELVWELPDAQLLDAAGEVKAAMEASGALCGLRAPFPVRLAAGPRWGRLAPLAPPAPATPADSGSR